MVFALRGHGDKLTDSAPFHLNLFIETHLKTVERRIVSLWKKSYIQSRW